MDYETGKIAEYVFSTQVIAQAKAVGMTLRVVRHRHADHPQGDRRDHRPAPDARRRARRPRSHRSRRARLQHVKYRRAARSRGVPLRSGEGLNEIRLGWRPGTAPSVERPRLTPRPLTFFGTLVVLHDCGRSTRMPDSVNRRTLLRSIAAAACGGIRPAAAQASAVLTRPIPVERRSDAAGRPRHLDHLQCRQRSAGARRAAPR